MMLLKDSKPDIAFLGVFTLADIFESPLKSKSFSKLNTKYNFFHSFGRFYKTFPKVPIDLESLQFGRSRFLLYKLNSLNLSNSNKSPGIIENPLVFRI